MASILDFGTRSIINARDTSEVLALKDLWEKKPCALFFLRRLGCPICRAYIQMVEKFRREYEAKGVNLVCLSFESFGEGSDFDRSFTKYAFWNGPIYTIDKSVYKELFGRKGLFDNFYGLLDIDKEALEKAKDVPGNIKGDGFQLGGQFIVHNGAVKLEHRQKLFGDDAKLLDIFVTLDTCLKPTSPKV
jgi:prostamide/prostaglandin F2alpha synthase